jgi:hypothetical protein
MLQLHSFSIETERFLNVREFMDTLASKFMHSTCFLANT